MLCKENHISGEQFTIVMLDAMPKTKRTHPSEWGDVVQLSKYGTYEPMKPITGNYQRKAPKEVRQPLSVCQHVVS